MANRILQITVLGACLAASPFVATQWHSAATNRPPADHSNKVSIPEAWPAGVQINRLADIGRGKAVIFSPDFAEPGNRKVYETLGFLYIEEASWQKAINQVVVRNYWHPDDRVESIFLETHGTNGNGLKLQAGVSPGARRSYISVGALLEKLEGLGVRLCVIGACSAGRLFRPDIYKTLKPPSGDRLFLAATLGIVNASPNYDPTSSKIVVVRRAQSEIETTSDGYTSELSAPARFLFGIDKPDGSRVSTNLHFVASNLLIQMLIRDPRLKLTASGYANEKSRRELSNEESEVLFERFLAFINQVAEREYHATRGIRLPATNGISNGPPPIAHSDRDPRKARSSGTQPRKLRQRRVID